MLAVGLLASCKPNEKEPVRLEAAPALLEFSAAGGEQTLSISTNGSWTIQAGTADWYTVEPGAGKGDATVKVRVAAYDGATDRSVTLVVASTAESGSTTADVALRQSRKPLPSDPAKQEFRVRAWGGTFNVAEPEGYDYEIRIDGDSWLTAASAESGVQVTVAENTTGAERTGAVRLVTSEDELLAEAVFVQGDRNIYPGDFLIEEIYFTSSLIEATGKPDKFRGDQFVKITNNTDEVLYADGIMFMEAKINSSQDHEYIDYDKSEFSGVQAIYVIPGSGRDVPVDPGKTVLIANNAQNHKENNPNSFDLTVADFEWFDESASSSIQDTDNPDVPNLDKWFCYTKTIWVMHDRGFQGYCIALPPAGVDKDSYLADYKWEGKYINHTPAGDFEMNISNAYRIPNDWILDAVNLGVEEVFFTGSFDASLDAGYTYCGKTDKDPERYGKSVIRRRDEKGKLIDTNNSASDFIPDSVPSLK